MADMLGAVLGDLPSGEMALLFVAHSCVLVRVGTTLLLFDPARPGPSGSFFGLGPLERLEGFQTHVFFSHGHADHYTPQAFSLPVRRDLFFHVAPDMDVPRSDHFVTVHEPGAWRGVGSVRIFTGPSSDEGVAWLVEVEGRRIYHSGDNAFWDWDANRTARGWYRAWLQPFISQGGRVDVAFQVADPRCHETHYGGIADLSDFLDVGLLVPIHNFGDFSHAQRIRDLVLRRHPGQDYWDLRGAGERRQFRPSRVP